MTAVWGTAAAKVGVAVRFSTVAVSVAAVLRAQEVLEDAADLESTGLLLARKHLDLVAAQDLREALHDRRHAERARLVLRGDFTREQLRVFAQEVLEDTSDLERARLLGACEQLDVLAAQNLGKALHDGSNPERAGFWFLGASDGLRGLFGGGLRMGMSVSVLVRMLVRVVDGVYRGGGLFRLSRRDLLGLSLSSGNT